MARLGLPLLLAAASVSAQAPNYLQNAETAMQGMQQQYYESGNGVWKNIGWWNDANALTTVAGLGFLDPAFRANATGIFADAYSNAAGNKRKVKKRTTDDGHVESVHGPVERERSLSDKWLSMLGRRDSVNWQSFTDNYYDDNGWWALAWIAAWDAWQIPDYLTLAQDIFDNNMVSGGPSTCGNGGIMWEKGNSYVNAIANELYFSVAAHLANRMGNQSAGYLQKAQAQLQWFQDSGMINGNSTINDGLSTNCQNNGGPVFTYNQGVILGGLVQLQKAAPSANNSYLTLAHSIAESAIATLADPQSQVLHDWCDRLGNCSPDEQQFKGIFMRNLAQLQGADAQDQYQSFITANADSVWNNARSPQNTFSVNWAGPYDSNSDDATTTSSALEAILAAVSLNPPYGG